MDKNRKSDLEQIMIDDEEILEKYFEIQMKDKIGEGAFGIVMRGIDMQDNKVCAIKVIQYLHSKLRQLKKPRTSTIRLKLPF